MPSTVKAPSGNSHAAVADRPDEARTASADLEQWLACLQQAMRDTGWTVDALAAHWDVDRGFAWRLVNGEKPWSVERVLSLPDDLEQRLEHRRAEGFGLIVVAPLRGLDAQKAFVAGLIGMMAAPDLPAKADRMARVSVADRKTKTA